MTEKNNTIKQLPGEKWKTLPGHKTAFGQHYAISDHGRLVKFTKSVEDGTVLRCSMQEGYPIWRTRKNGEHYHALLHRLVAKHFLPKPKKSETIVIHVNHKKTDNRAENLDWVTAEEATAHAQNSPAVKKAKKIMRERVGGGYNTKLTEAKVKKIKQLLGRNKTLKEIARQFGVSDMQIHRIKTGENWAHI